MTYSTTLLNILQFTTGGKPDKQIEEDFAKLLIKMYKKGLKDGKGN